MTLPEKQQELLPPWATCDPEDVGMDREPLEKCRGYLHYRIKRKHFAGIVGGVVKNGKLVYFDEAGYADIEGKVPMRQDTLMRLFSMTKSIIIVAFLTYAEDPAFGIDLDDPVWKYLPSFKHLKLAPKRGADKPRDLDLRTFTINLPNGEVKKQKLPTGPTLRQLLTHTAGLGYGPTLGDNIPPERHDHYRIYYDLLERSNSGQIGSLAEWVDELAKVPLKVKPGSYWEYSFASDVLGRVLEVISGTTLDKVVEERVCGPLGMVDTSFEVPAHKAHRMGAWYEKKDPVDDKGNPYEKVPPGATYGLNVIDKPGAESGWVGTNCSRILSAGGTIEVPLSIKGGMVSTFRDYLRFLLMIRNMGELDGVRILRRETVQVALCNQIPASTGRRAAWVFDKKGQGFSFLGQIQVQYTGKDTFQEKGELKKGGNTLASLAPGTTSAEFGWGGLGGPAWTIDPRQDLIVLSMTQTALELDHEENLRFSARRAIHAGIFGLTAGPMKVTDYPPEAHEGLKGRKLQPTVTSPFARPVPVGVDGTAADADGVDRGDADVGTNMNVDIDFLQAEQHALDRGKSLKELAVARGNVGHEVPDDREDADDADEKEAVPSQGRHDDEGRDAQREGPAAAAPAASPETAAEAGLAPPQKRQLEREATSGSEGGQQPPKRQATGGGSRPDFAGGPRPTRANPINGSKEDGLLFSRVRVQGGEDWRKARVTCVDGESVEVVTEGTYETLKLDVAAISVIDESHFVTSSHASNMPKDFSFLMKSMKDPSSNSKQLYK